MAMCRRTIMHVCAVGALAVATAVALGGCEGRNGTATSGAQSPATSTQGAPSGAAGTRGAGTARQTSSAGIGISNSGGTGSANGASSGAAACGNDQLSVQQTMPDASAGHRSLVLLFTNTSGSSCTISGYPGAAVTDKQGRVVLNANRSLAGYEGGAAGVTTVTLSPGGHASSVIEWLGFPTDGQAPVGANCPGMDGGSLLITPPNTRKTSSFSSPSDLCADFSVHPAVAGTSGRSQS
jgi:hypothetical protein